MDPCFVRSMPGAEASKGIMILDENKRFGEGGIVEIRKDSGVEQGRTFERSRRTGDLAFGWRSNDQAFGNSQ